MRYASSAGDRLAYFAVHGQEGGPEKYTGPFPSTSGGDVVMQAFDSILYTLDYKSTNHRMNGSYLVAVGAILDNMLSGEGQA